MPVNIDIREGECVMPGQTMRRKRGRPPRDLAPDRGEILRLALTAFARDGFEGTNLRAIAAAAGVDVALLARHFGPKLDLWKSVVDEITRRMADARAEVAALCAPENASGEAIGDALRRFVAFSAAVPELGKFFADEISRPGVRRDYVIERLWQPHRTTMLPLLVEGQRAGLIRGSDPEMLLLVLIGAVAMPLMMLSLAGAEAGDGEGRLATAVAELFLRR